MNRRSNMKRLLLTTSVCAIAAGLAPEAQAACTAITAAPNSNNPTTTNLVCVTLPANVGTGFTNSVGVTIGLATKTAVQITANTLSGSFVNHGVISGVAAAGTAAGMNISAAGVLSAGIVNTGSIFGTGTAAGANGIGIKISAATFGGGISNSGQVEGASVVTTGVGVGTGIALSGPTFSGGVSNSGDITGAGHSGGRGFNITVSNFSGGVQNSGFVEAFASSKAATGINVNGASFSGGIINSSNALILAAASSQAYGIRVHGVGTFSGGINNAGSIAVGAGDATAVGIDVGAGVGTFSGGISNSGSIGVAATGGSAFGIRVSRMGTFSGGIANSGQIGVSLTGGTAAGIAVGSMGTFAGGISNSGAISVGVGSGQAVGIAVGNMGTFSGGIVNAQGGFITAAVSEGNAVGIGVGQMGPFSGGILNAGGISAVAFSGVATGIAVGSMGTFSGGISNSGSIFASAPTAAAGIFVQNVGTFAGGIASSGNITAVASNGFATGIGVFNISQFSGGISNSGSINASLNTGGAYGILVQAVTSFDGGIANSGAIVVSVGAGGAFGILVGPTNPTSSFTNIQRFSGGITNSSTGFISVTNFDGNAVGIAVGAQQSGGADVDAFIGNFSGGITNAGTITVSASFGQAIGIFAGGVDGSSGHFTGISNFSGGIANASTGFIGVSAVSGNAIGIFAGGIGGSHTASMTGISTFSGGITNAGTIVATTTGGNAFGIAVGGIFAGASSLVGISTFDGGISNSGTIIVQSSVPLVEPAQFSGASGSNAIGIFVGGIGNIAGTSGALASNGVLTFSGGIANSGTIMATAFGGNAVGIFAGGVGFVAPSGTYNFAGISTFSGGIVNSASGVISVQSEDGIAAGIFVGAISGGEGQTGIFTFSGGISNAGSIFASASDGAAIGIGAGSVIGYGPLSSLRGVQTFDGGISNSGFIQATAFEGNAYGILVGHATSYSGFGGVSTFSGGISNSGTIIAAATFGNAYGILANGSYEGDQLMQTFSGGISNSGLIQVSAHGTDSFTAVGIGAFGISTFSGGVQNSGTITVVADEPVGEDPVGARAYGIYLYNISTFSGGVSNSGRISATAVGSEASAVGINLDRVSTFSGGITNSGTIIASNSGTGSDAYGIRVQEFQTFSGGIVNTAGGLINVGGGQFAAGIAISGGELFDGGVSNAGTIIASAFTNAVGISIDPTVFNGGVTNSGVIRVSAAGDATGIFATGASTFNGGIVNSAGGLIHAIAGGEGNGRAAGIVITQISQFNGGINNAGTIIAENRFIGSVPLHAYGIYVDVSVFNGGITNSGTIKALTTKTDVAKVAGASGVGIFSTSAVIGTITNTGTIIGTNWAIDLSQSQGQNTINVSSGFVGGGINLSNTFADTVNITGGRVEASILGAEGTVNLSGTGVLTVPIDRTFFQGPPDQTTRDLSQTKSVGTGTTPIMNFIATGGTINFDIDGTPSVPLTGVGVNTLTGGGIETRNGYIIAQNTTLGPNTAVTVTPMPDLYLNGTVYHQVINGVNTFSDSIRPALVDIVLPGGTVPSTLLMSFTLTADTCTVAIASCAGHLTAEGGADQINLTVRPFENPLGVGLTPNEIQAGHGLDALAHSPNGLVAFGTSSSQSLGGLFLITNPQTYQTALDQLGGYQIAQGFNLSMGIPIYTGEQIQTLLAAGPNRGGMVQSARLSNSGIQVAAAGKIVTDAGSNQVAQGDGAVGPSAAPWTFWGRGYGVFGNADSQTSPNHVAGYNEQRGGGIFGADYTFNEHWLLGGAINYSHNNMNFNQNAGNTDVGALLLGIYGQYRQGPWYVNGTFQGGWDWYNTSRNITVPIVATANSSYDGQTYGVYGETGWDFLTNNWKLTPFVGFGWVHGAINSFTETGAGPADLAVHDSSADSVQSTLGGRISTRLPLGGSFIVPEVRAAWQHEFGDQAHSINNSFALSPTGVFSQQGTVFGRDAGVFGASLTYEVRSDLKVFADFDYKYMSNYNAEAVMAGLKLSFGAPAPLPPKAAPPATPVPPPASARLFVVYFNFDKFDLTTDGQKVVDEAVAAFKQTGNVQVKVDGYTDLAGTQAYNLNLSHKRADTVRAALVKGGIPASAIVEAWHGKDNPAVPTADGVREARNRRATILLP